MAFHAFSMESNRARMVSQGRFPQYYSPMMGHGHPGFFEGVIDPSLEADSSATIQPRGHCSVPQIERYLSEQQTPFFEAPKLYPTQNDLFSPLEPDVIHPLPSRSPGRHDSPFPRQSSTGSGAQSPRTDSDLFNDSTQGPSTPSDLAVMSPYVASAIPYDPWDGQSAQFSLTGLSFSPSGGFVNPSEINPNQCSLMDCTDTENPLDLSFHSGSSFDAAISPQYQDATYNSPSFSQPESLDLEQPEPRRKIRAQLSHPTTYPDPDPKITDEDTKSPDASGAQIDHREDEDEDYKPNSRSKPSRGQKNASRRPRQKRSSTSTVVGARVFKNTVPPSDGRKMLTVQSSPKACAECKMPFKDEAAFQKHIKTQHTRPFTCVFHYAGCKSTFATKNEWKRHVWAQHLALHYWLCRHDSCAQVVSPNNGPSGALIYGRPFRRKDLFTQHARRMHLPSEIRKTGKTGGTIPREWDEKLKSMQENAHQQRCRLPTYMRCPVQGCTFEFNGERAWDERMEHVARHLERAATDEEPKVQFGGPNDDTLTRWAESHDVGVVCRTATGWKLCSPLKEAKGDSITVSQVRRQSDSDEDAEGEEYFH